MAPNRPLGYRRSRSCRYPGHHRKAKTLEHVRLGVHIWVSILIMGTVWRLATLHLVASKNTTLQHVGRAMGLQY